jgi:hypothetical protein
MSADALDEIATLIGEIGRCYQRGRRYRAIASTCEERYLARALEVGSIVRRARRLGDLAPQLVASLIATLRDLQAECERAIRGVRAGAPYRRALAAWEAGAFDEVAVLAQEVFAGVEPYGDCPALYHAVAIAGRAGGPDRFITPHACADAVVALVRDGLVASEAPPDLGADESIRAVTLDDDPERLESPIALVIDPAGLPVCRVAPSGDALIYAARLPVTPHVYIADGVSDEWWAVRPEAYADYARRLRVELTSRGVSVLRGAR